MGTQELEVLTRAWRPGCCPGSRTTFRSHVVAVMLMHEGAPARLHGVCGHPGAGGAVLAVLVWCP